MRYRRLGCSGLQVAEIGLGTMMFGEKTGAAESARIVHRALDAGVNLIDVADVYAGGESERLVGSALRGRRAEAILATKVGRPTALGEGLSRRYIEQAAEASLKRLQTDYIDLYQVHYWDGETPLAETVAALDALVRAGKIRWWGCSNWSGEQVAAGVSLARAEGWAPLTAVQPRYNLACREAEADLLPRCPDLDVGVLAYSPLAGGVLTGKYLAGIPEGSRGWQNPAWQQRRLTPAAQAAAGRLHDFAARLGRPPEQVALRWCLAHPAVTSVLVGPRTDEQWEAALAAASWELEAAQARELAGDP